MSYPRNAASPPPVLVGQVVQISDGAVQTSGASVRVRTGTGSWGAGAGTLSCDATSGFWDYLPTQGETNAESFEVAVYKSSCLGCGQSVVTSASATAGKVVLSGETHTSAVIPTVTTLTNAPSDSSGTTTLLSRLSSARAGYLDNINNANLASVPAFPSNFASLGINASGHVSRVVLCDTITTYTGNTPQTGDAYAIVNSGTYGNSAIKSALDITASQVSLVYTSIYAGQGTVAASPSPTTTSFASGRTEASGFWDDAKITFTSGALSGQTRIVSSYGSTNGAFAFDEALTSAPSSGDTFSILRGHDHTQSQIADAVRTELATELARVDVATSTRLATADYSAPLDAAGVRSAVGLASANLDTQLGDLPTGNEIADAVLGRSVSNSESTAAEHSLCTVVLAMLESSVSGATWTIKRTNGTTTHATKAVTTDAAAEPVTGVS